MRAHEALEEIQNVWRWASAHTDNNLEFVALGKRVEKMCTSLAAPINEKASLSQPQVKWLEEIIVRISTNMTPDVFENPLLFAQALLQLAIYINSCGD